MGGAAAKTIQVDPRLWLRFRSINVKAQQKLGALAGGGKLAAGVRRPTSAEVSWQTMATPPCVCGEWVFHTSQQVSNTDNL